jgi:hypothetical protein
MRPSFAMCQILLRERVNVCSSKCQQHAALDKAWRVRLQGVAAPAGGRPADGAEGAGRALEGAPIPDAGGGGRTPAATTKQRARVRRQRRVAGARTRAASGAAPQRRGGDARRALCCASVAADAVRSSAAEA